MTDRHQGYNVILEKEMREDDGECILSAIRQIKGVLDVKPIVADHSMDFVGYRHRLEILKRFEELIRTIYKEG